MITFSYENLQIVTFRRKVIIENFFVNLFFFTKMCALLNNSAPICCRILRKVASDKTDDLGDLSTLGEPEILQKIIEKHNSGAKWTEIYGVNDHKPANTWQKRANDLYPDP